MAVASPATRPAPACSTRGMDTGARGAGGSGCNLSLLIDAVARAGACGRMPEFSRQRGEIAAQTVGAGARNQAIDCRMGVPPDRESAGEQCASGGRQLEPAAAPVVGV